MSHVIHSQQKILLRHCAENNHCATVDVNVLDFDLPPA